MRSQRCSAPAHYSLKNRSESYHSSVRLLLLITRQELLSRDRQILLYYIPNSIFSEIKIKQLVPPNGMVFFFHHEAIISLSHPKNRLKQRSAAALILQSNLVLVDNCFIKLFQMMVVQTRKSQKRQI